MTNVAELGLRIDSDDYVTATRRGRDFEQQGQRIEGTAGRMAGALGRVAIGFATVAGAAAVSVVFGQGLRAFASYEQGLRNVAAVSGATAEELERLDAAALGAAASTRFNPSQTTSALYSLASAGQNANEQIASLPNVLNLAEAAQADLGQTTELLVSTLSQYNLAATESQRVADVFTASIGASALNVDRLQVAFRNAGPTASALNQSLEGTTSVLGILTTAFGNGERAGTGFRAILNELPAQAAELGVNLYDSTGAMRPFVDILADLEDGGLTASTAVRMFGAEAGPALAALLTSGSDALATMEDRLTSTGQAAEVAGRQLDTLQGDFDGLRSAIDVALVEIGRSQEGFARPAIQTLTNLIRLWSGYGDTLGDALEPTQRISDAIERVGYYAATAATGFVAYRGAMLAATIATSGLSGALVFLRGALIRTGIGIAIVAVGELVYRFAQLVERTDGVGQAFSLLGEVAAGVWSGMVSAAGAIPVGLAAIWESVKADFLRMVQNLSGIWSGFISGMADAARNLPGMSEGFGPLNDAAASATAQMREFGMAAAEAEIRAMGLRDQSVALATDGWGRRIADIQAKGVAWALVAMNGAIAAEQQIEDEAAEADASATQQQGGAATSGAGAAGAGGVGATGADQAIDFPMWLTWGLAAALIVLAVFLFLKARQKRQQAQAYRREAKAIGA